MDLLVKQRLSEKIIQLLVVCFGLIIILLPVHAFISTWGGVEIGPLLVWKSWKEILLALLVPGVILLCYLRPQIAKQIWSRLINKLIAGYVVLHLLLAFFAQASPEAIMASLLMNLRFLAMFILAQVIVASGHPGVALLKTIMPISLLWITLGLSIVAITQVTIWPKDFLTYFGYDNEGTIAPVLLIDSNPEALRAFATMRGPNTLGAYLLLPLLVALFYVTKRRDLWLSATVLLLGLITLWLTGSRSAWVGLLVALVAFALLFLPHAVLLKWLKFGTVPALIIGGIMIWVAISVPSVRLAIFHSSPGDAHIFEGSTQKHWEATLQGAGSVLANPLGTGPGSAGPASFYNSQGVPNLSENYFVQIGQEAGVLGLLLFLVICWQLVVILYQRKEVMAKLLLASFIGLTTINLFLHGWADDPTAMTWWGLAGLFIAGTSHSKKD